MFVMTSLVFRAELRRRPLDGAHLLAGNSSDPSDAGAHCHTVDLHRAGAALSDTAAELSAGQSERVTQLSSPASGQWSRVARLLVGVA